MTMTNTVELGGLEHQVDHLLRLLERLQAENIVLRQRLTAHTREQSYRTQQNQQVATRIKKIISQLREQIA